MKIVKIAAALFFIGALLSSCASHEISSHSANQATTDVVRHFHEAKAANVVLQFSSWEYTFLLRPRYDDNGFLLQVPRDKVKEVLRQVGVPKRELAVVVVGWSYSPEQLRQLVADWKIILGGCGFQRVVVIKSRGSKELDGALVIDDSILSGGSPPSLTRL